VTVYGDTKYEGQEVFYVKLTSATGADIVIRGAEGQRTDFAILYIPNDDPKGLTTPTVALSTSGLLVDEGNTVSKIVPLVVKLSAPSDQAVTVFYRVGNAPVASRKARVAAVGFASLNSAPGDAATVDVDFLSATGSIVFAPGQVEATVPVTIYGDRTAETDEYLPVSLTSATNAVVAADASQPDLANSVIVTIQNDDPMVSIYGAVPPAKEGDAGTTTVPVIVELSQATDRQVTVTYTISGYGPAATPGVDFLAETGSLTFEPGQTQATVPLTVYGDTEYEGDGYVTVAISDPVNADLGVGWNYHTTSYMVTIQDDDPYRKSSLAM
jgi:hypothetical protein